MIPDISVIVPVYKVEPYIRQCLDSLIHQTKKEIEIILIDDGSPDNCGKICDEYAKSDDRIKVIHQENKGISATRNIGIDNAAADYIMFTDSDDWVTPNFCARAYQLITENEADVVLFNYFKVKEDKLMPRRIPDIKEGFKTMLEAQKLLFSPSGCYCWDKIFRKELFTNIRFPEGRVYEDLAVTCQIVFQAKKIWYTGDQLYYYRTRKGSIVITRNLKNRNDAYEAYMDRVHALEAYPETREMAAQQLDIVSLLYCIWHKKDPGDTRYIDAENQLMSIKGKIPSYFSKERKVLLFLFWHCRWLFNLLCILIGRRVS